MEEQTDELNELLAAIENPDVPNVYSNGFICALGTGDVAILFKNTGMPVTVLNLSYTATKTLSLKLQELISHLESKSNTVIMTSDEIATYLKAGE